MTGQKKHQRGDRGGTSEPQARGTSTTTVEGSSARPRGREDRTATLPTGQRPGTAGNSTGSDIVTPSGSGAPATRRRQPSSEEVVVPPAAGELIPAEAQLRDPSNGRDARAETTAAAGADAPAENLPALPPVKRQIILLDRPPPAVNFKKPVVVTRGVPAPPPQRNASRETLQAGSSSAPPPSKKRSAGDLHQTSRLGSSSSSTGDPDEGMHPCWGCSTPTHSRVPLCARCHSKRGRGLSCRRNQ
ncbi:hypothetical protein ACQJBY_001684 [Aegilops geniculata]